MYKPMQGCMKKIKDLEKQLKDIFISSSKMKISEKLLERKREQWKQREKVYMTWDT